jgi:hypothetical protein
MSSPKSDSPVELANRRTLLRAGLIGAGSLGMGTALSNRTIAQQTKQATAAKDAVYICPISLNAVYNGVYYYAAMTCDPNHTGSTMTSSSRLSPLGCTSDHKNCHLERFAPGTNDTARHHVRGDNGGKSFKAFKKVKVDEPFLVAEGEGTLIGSHKDYLIDIAGTFKLVRLYMVFCTPTGGTPDCPRPPILMGVGQELDSNPNDLEDGSVLEVIKKEEQVLHLRRKTDRVDFFVILGGA